MDKLGHRSKTGLALAMLVFDDVRNPHKDLVFSLIFFASQFYHCFCIEEEFPVTEDGRPDDDDVCESYLNKWLPIVAQSWYDGHQQIQIKVSF